MTMLLFDHLVIAARTLQDGVAYAQERLGVPVPPGGRHPLMGTHNHVLRLGAGCFLEVIATDPGTVPQRRRWFNLDDPSFQATLTSPRLVHWVVRTDHLEKALAIIPHAQGPAITVTRGALRWQIGVPDNGALAFDGAFPTFIAWAKGPLPADTMADHGCRLKRLVIRHPEAETIRAALAPYLSDSRLAYETGHAELAAEIETPSGIKRLT